MAIIILDRRILFSGRLHDGESSFLEDLSSGIWRQYTDHWLYVIDTAHSSLGFLPFLNNSVQLLSLNRVGCLQGMLERVPATAECAAHAFLRSFERPNRSSRLLDPRFWQHDCDQLVTPSTSAVWWPQYLQKIRQIPQASCASDVTDAQSVKHATGPKCKRTLRASSSDHLPRRAYSVAASLRANKPVLQSQHYDAHSREHDGVIRDESILAVDTTHGVQSWRPYGQSHQQNDPVKENERRHTSPAAENVLAGMIPEMEDIPNDGPAEKRPQPVSRALASPREAKTRLEAGRSARRQDLEPDKAISPRIDSSLKLHVLNQLLDEDEDLTEKQLDQIWRLFIALPDQESFAKFVYPCLARTKISHRLDRATEALRLIPTEDKDLDMYKQGMYLYFRQDRIHEAVELVRGARPHYAAALRSILCARLVDRELWHTLSDLLVDHTCALEDLHSCLGVSELPEKLIRLRRRLTEGDPIFEDTFMLDEASAWLNTACIRSESVMSTISAESLLDLLHQPQRNEARPHLQALFTLSRKEVRKDKQDIALGVYRDFLSFHPSENVKRAMLGSLLSICAASGYSPTTLTYVLDEFTTHLRRPDEKAYLLVLTMSSKHGTIAEVESFFERFLEDHETPPDMRFVSPLIHACARVGEIQLAEYHFNQVKDKYGFEQDAHCWNMLVDAYAHSSEPLSAFDVFDSMTSAGVSPDAYTYGTLIAVSADFEDAQTAQDLIVSARKAGIPTTVPMIGALVDAYLSQNNFDKAREFVLATTQTKTSETRLWNILLRYCAAKNEAKLFASTMADMQRYRVKLDDWTYASMLLLLTSTGKTMEAVMYLRKLQKSQSFRASQLHYSIILHGFVMEHNRDMALVIEQEMKSQLPKLDAKANEALLAIEFGDTENPQRSIDLLASSLISSDLERKQGVSSQSSGGAVAIAHGPAQAYTKTILHSLRRNQHFELADRLVNLLKQQNPKEHGGGRQARHQSIQYMTLKMDAALAQSNLKEVERLWSLIFEKTMEAGGSNKALRGRLQSMGAEAKLTRSLKPSRTATADSSQQAEAVHIPEHAAYRLSKPLDKYMEALARGQKQLSMVLSIEQFESAGFKLSGSNWNKYVQVMARSKFTDHHISAFKTVETLMLRHAQNWTLLRRGLFRQNNTSYSFEKESPDKPRPVLIKEREYSVTDRLELLHRNPTRKIPTYTTMVFLARVLEDAQRRAQVADVTEIRELSNIAPRTKKFLEHMPRLRDDVQGEILRDHARRPELLQQSRSESHHPGVYRPKLFAAATHGARNEYGISDTAGNKQTVSGDGSASPGHMAGHAATSADQIMRSNAARAMDRAGNKQQAESVVRGLSSPLATDIRRVISQKGKYRPLALEYAEHRRERTRNAARQRQQVVVDDNQWLSARDPPVPQSGAARRALRYRLNQERRSRLREEIHTKGRPGVAPLPKTKHGVYRRRRLHGATPVRFVFDLNRSKVRHAVRSGKLPESRKGLAQVDQREYMVDKNTRHLLLDRKQPASRHDVQVVRGKIGRNKRLVNLYWNSRRERVRRLRTASIFEEKKDILQARALRPPRQGLSPAGKVSFTPMQ